MAVIIEITGMIKPLSEVVTSVLNIRSDAKQAEYLKAAMRGLIISEIPFNLALRYEVKDLTKGRTPLTTP